MTAMEYIRAVEVAFENSTRTYATGRPSRSQTSVSELPRVNR